MVVELNFGITCGVGVVLFWRHFQNFIALVVTRIPILRMSCLFLISDYFGIFDSIESPKIGRWNNLIFFWNFIHSMTFTGEGQDKLCWKSTKNKGFKVSEFYLSLFSTPDNLFPWKLVWHSNIPPRVAFFSWTAALGKILTLDRLWNKGVPVMDWCYMCKRSGESVNHHLSSLSHCL